MQNTFAPFLDRSSIPVGLDLMVFKHLRSTVYANVDTIRKTFERVGFSEGKDGGRNEPCKNFQSL